MEIIDNLIARQIRKPSGVAGRLLGHLMAKEHMPLAAWMMETIPVGPASHVLDVGCGGGMTLKMLAGLAPDGFIAGVDYAPDMVRQARSRNMADIRAGRMEIVQGDVAALPFPDGRFDAVVGVETIYFWRDPLAGLREVCRVLKPGGAAATVVDTSKASANAPAPQGIDLRMDMRIYSAEELEALFRSAGFEDVRSRTEPGRGKGWLCTQGRKPAREGMA